MDKTTDIFKDDALNRVNFATNLSKFIYGLPSGVIAIDGAWGSGKTWFGERVSNLLCEGAQIKTVWIDTFTADWTDDPALSILATFAEQLDDDKRTKFFEALAPLAGKALTSATKAGLRIAGNLIGVDKDVVDGISSAAKDAGDDYIKLRLKELSERKKSLKSLQTLLAKSVKENSSKVVVFVDELDRCSPAYAIRFLERIKHLFAVDGVVFVLLWNRVQIQQAVKAFYGQESDGQMYLDRFVDFPIHLPNHHTERHSFGMGLLIHKEISSLPNSKSMLLDEMSQLAASFAEHLGLTAREVKHVCSWYVISASKRFAVLEFWLLCLKVKRPDIYSELRTESIAGHQNAVELLSKMKKDNDFEHIYTALKEFHKTCISKDASNFVEHVENLFYQKNFSEVLTITKSSIARIESIRP